MKRMKLKRFLVLIILIIVTTITSKSNIFEANNNLVENDDNKVTVVDTILPNGFVLKSKKDDVKAELLSEVEKYICNQAKTADKNIPEYLVEQCLENEMDLCFVMAQTQLETNFGTTGIGTKNSKRSMFGIKHRSYDNYEQSIEDYIAVVQEKYLGDRKTIHQLMKNYVTLGGHRYAKSKTYENKLFKHYSLIKNKTNIYNLQKQYLSL